MNDDRVDQNEEEPDEESYAEHLAQAAEARALVSNPQTLIQSTYVGLSTRRNPITRR